MEITTIVLVALVIWVIRQLSKSTKIAKMLDTLPGPPLVPIFGNLLSVMVSKEKRMKVCAHWDSTYGPIYRTWMGPNLPHIHIVDPELAEVVLSNSKYTKKGIFYRLFRIWLGTGLITGSGDKWSKHRKLLTKAFHFQVLDDYIEIFNENAQVLISQLKEKSKTGEIFDVFPLITLCALDIISESAMGIKIKAQKEEYSEYVKSMYRMIALTIDRSTELWNHWDSFYYLTPAGRESKKVAKFLHEYAEKVIQERRRTRLSRRETENKPDVDEVGVKRKKSFLDLMLDTAEDQSIKLTNEEIREEVDTFMFAGHDTTTAGVSWVIFMLGNNPEIQAEAYEEQKRIFGDDMERKVTMKDLNEMKLLERIIKETLRLYPATPIISRYVDHDIKIGKQIIPSGVQICVHIRGMHHDQKVFPDPMKFDPDRFLPEQIQIRHPFAYIPFSAGPRNCIGQKFAVLEEKALLSIIIRNFIIQSTEKPEDVPVIFELILRPFGGIKIKLTSRT